MSSSNSQPERRPATLYDPAYDTLRFDILVVLSLIYGTDICDRCKHATFLTAKRAFEGVLNADSQYPNRGSHIQHVTIDPDDGVISFTTTANPTPVSIRDALLTRDLLSPSAAESLVDRVLDPLFFPSDDVLNLSQTQLWFCVAGRYTLTDAIQGRSLAEFAHTHMQLMNNICGRGRTGAQANQASFCARGPNSRCFGLPMAEGYPYPEKRGWQSGAALRHAMKHMDFGVKALVEDQLWDTREWPAELNREHPDRLVILAKVEKLPAFRARMEALRKREEYQMVEGEVEEVVREWRVRGWEEEVEVDEKEDVDDTKRMLQELVQQFMEKLQLGY